VLSCKFKKKEEPPPTQSRTHDTGQRHQPPLRSYILTGRRLVPGTGQTWWSLFLMPINAKAAHPKMESQNISKEAYPFTVQTPGLGSLKTIIAVVATLTPSERIAVAARNHKPINLWRRAAITISTTSINCGSPHVIAWPVVIPNWCNVSAFIFDVVVQAVPTVNMGFPSAQPGAKTPVGAMTLRILSEEQDIEERRIHVNP